MYGHELRLPDHLAYATPPTIQCSTDYVRTKIETLSNVHEILREKQWELRVEDEDEPLLFKKGDYVLVKRQSTKKGLSSKLQSKYSGPFVVEKAFPNHTYQLSKHNRTTVQNEALLKLLYLIISNFNQRSRHKLMELQKKNQRKQLIVVNSINLELAVEHLAFVKYQNI